MESLGLNRPVLGGKVNFPVCLAPMVGLSHKYFRLLLRSYLPEQACTLWPTEMLSSRRLPAENLKLVPETQRGDEETELCPQILGNDETYIKPSVEKLTDWGAAAIDINMGCPVKKALRHNYGVALMGDKNYARQVVAITVRHSKIPVSVKLRAGLQEDLEYLESFLKGLEDAGASWITLHPRLASEKRRGRAKWEQIRFVREKLSIPVLGNGDIQTADDAIEMLQETGCDMAMIGRALTARPWLLWQVGEKLGFKNPVGRSGSAPRTAEEEGAEYGRALLQLVEIMKGHINLSLALRQFRFFVRTGSVWLVFGNALYSEVSRARSFDELESNIREFFSRPQEMSARTFLRQ